MGKKIKIYQNQNENQNNKTNIVDSPQRNIIIGDKLGNNEQLTIDDLKPYRYFKIRLLTRKSFLSLFIIVIIASILGLVYSFLKDWSFSIAANFKPLPSWLSSMLMLIIALSVMFIIYTNFIKKQRRISQYKSKFLIEIDGNDRIYLTKFNGICPICGAKMYLKNDDFAPYYFRCIQKPLNHRFIIDKTTLPDIKPDPRKQRDK